MGLSLLTPTPPPGDIAQAVEQVTRLTDVFSNMTFGMAALLVMFMLSLIVLAIVLANRKTVPVVIDTLAKSNADKSETIESLMGERKEELKTISNATREMATNTANQTALLTAINERGAIRDEAQAQADSVQRELVGAVNSLVNEGSMPLRKLISDVASVTAKIDGLDSKATGIPGVIAQDIKTLRDEMNAKLDALTVELQRRSTKPIPQLNPELISTQPNGDTHAGE